MNSETQCLAELRERIYKLEKQNRRLKQIGASALLIGVCVLVMGQAPRKRTIEATEFILKDANGKVRATLALNGKSALPGFILFDANGTPRVLMAGEMGNGLYFNNAHGENRASLSAVEDGLGLLGVRGANGDAYLAPGSLGISDNEGLKADIGAVRVPTPRFGEYNKTSAASVILFDKDRNVIWKAP